MRKYFKPTVLLPEELCGFAVKPLHESRLRALLGATRHRAWYPAIMAGEQKHARGQAAIGPIFAV